MTLADGSHAGESHLRFATLDELHAAHAALLQHREQHDLSAAVLDAATAFVERGVRTGALLYDTNDRRAAQSLLNYWSNILYRADREPPDALLMLFDQSQAPLLDNALCPYIGLDPFDEQRKNLFFGRGDLVKDLISHLRDHRFLAVVGPSGSGKSSLVRAGLIPALRAGALPGSVTWRYIRPIVPGSHPLGQLAQMFRPRSADPADWERRRVADFLRDDSHLAMLISKLPAAPTVLVIDQFEELFTLVDNKHEVRAFAANLARLAETPGLRHTVIVTLREKFVQRIAEVPPLEGLFRDSRKQVTALLRAELREAIIQPAKQVGLIFDDWVVDKLVEDLAGDPAVLPLLQFTLRQLWNNKDRNRITRAIYTKVGEGGKALEQAADAFYDRQPTQENRDTIKLILLRMVEARQLGEFTSRRIRRESLYTIPNTPQRIDRMLAALIKAGLVRLTPGTTPTDDQVELAHEALIRNWQKLRDWLEEQRDQLRERQRLTSAADQWNAGGRDSGALWVSRELVKTTSGYSDLSPLEQDFIAASKAAIQAQDDAARRDLEQAQALAEERARTNQRLQRQRLWLIITTLIAIIAAGVAYQLYSRSEVGRRASDGKLLVLKLHSLIKSNRKSSMLPMAFFLATRQQQSTSRAAADDQQVHTEHLDYQNLLQRALQLSLQPISYNEMIGASWNSNDQIATIGKDRAIRIWNMETLWSRPSSPRPDTIITRTLTITPTQMMWNQLDGRLLTVDQDGRARIRDGRTGVEQYALPPNKSSSKISYAAWSADGQQILTVGAETTSGHTKVNLWNARTYTLNCTLGDYLVPPTLTTLSPDGRYVFVAHQDSKSELWSVDEKSCNLIDNPNTDGTLNAVDWSPDGRLLVTASDNQANIWHVHDRTIDKNPAAVLIGHTEPIVSVDWSQDGTRILTAGEDKTVRIWEVAQRQNERNGLPQLEISINQLPELQGEWIEMHRAIWSHDSRMILVDGSEQREGGTDKKDPDKTVRVYIADDLDQVLSMARRQLTTAQNSELLNAEDKNILAEMAKDTLPELAQEIALIPSAATESTHTNATFVPSTITPTAIVSATAFVPSPSPTLLAVTIITMPTTILTVTTGLTPTVTIMPVALPPTPEPPTPEPPTPEVSTPEPIDTPTPEPAPTSTPPIASAVPNVPPPSQLLGHSDFVLEARFSADGTLIASASKDGTARVWRASDGAQLQVLHHDARVNSVAFSPKENILLSSSDDQKGRIWDANDGHVIAELPHDGRVNNAEFSPDGRWVVTASRDNTANIWHANNGALACTLPHDRQVFTALFSNDSSKLVTAVGDATAQIWSVVDHNCTLLRTLQGHTDSVLSARFDKGGGRVITASTDGTARIWDANTGDTLFVLRGHTGWVRRPSFSPDGTLALTASDDGTARIWDAKTGALVAVLQHGGAVNAARFSNNGNYISTASEDGIARLWNARNGQLIAELRGHNDPVISAEFNRDDDWLVTAGLDGSVRLWPVPAIPAQ